MTALVDLVVFAYLGLALLSDLPWGGRLLAPLAPLVRFFGFEQNWGMFTPDPPTSDRDLAVLVELPAGGALVWEPPRLADLPRGAAFLRFRYRSYEHALLYGEGAPASWAALGDYLLRKYDVAGTEPPRTAVFIWVDRPLPPYGREGAVGAVSRASFHTHRAGDGS
jgi:hypothetical protein